MNRSTHLYRSDPFREKIEKSNNRLKQQEIIIFVSLEILNACTKRCVLFSVSNQSNQGTPLCTGEFPGCARFQEFPLNPCKITSKFNLSMQNCVSDFA